MSNIKSAEADAFVVEWVYEKRGIQESGVEAIYSRMTDARKHIRVLYPTAKERKGISNTFFVEDSTYSITAVKFNQCDMYGYTEATIDELR